MTVGAETLLNKAHWAARRYDNDDSARGDASARPIGRRGHATMMTMRVIVISGCMPHGMGWHGIAQLRDCGGVRWWNEPVGGVRQLLPGRAAAGAHPHDGEVATVIASQHHHALSVRSAYCHFDAD